MDGAASRDPARGDVTSILRIIIIINVVDVMLLRINTVR